MSKIHVEHDRLIIKSLFSSREIPYNSIQRMVVSTVLSLCDELGLFLYCPDQILIDELDPKFPAIIKALNFPALFGPNWYARVEAGEVLEWIKPKQ